MRPLLTCLALLLAALLTACGAPARPQPLPHRTLIVAYYDTTPSDLAAISEAAAEWRYKTNSIATFDIRFVEHRPAILEPTEVYVQSLKSDDPVLKGKDSLLAFYMPSRTMLYLISDRLQYKDYMRVVLIHELGHILQLGHSPISTAIMYEYPLMTRHHITGDDQVAFCVIYGCDPLAFPSN